jgi:hypothetical protein
MNRKSSLAAISALSTLILGLPINLLSSEPGVQAWYRENLGLVLVLTVVLAGIAITAEASNALDQADQEGDSLSGAGVAGTLIAAAVTWAVGGAVLGWTLDSLVWPHLADGRGFPGPAVTGFLLRAGPLQVACLLVGVFAGERLRFADHEHPGPLAFAGFVAGGAIGLVASSYFALAGPVRLSPLLVVGAPAFAAAVVGASIATFTAAFKPRFDRQERRARRLKEDAAGRRREQDEADLELFERTATRLRRLGYETRAADPATFDFRRLMLDLMIHDLAQDMEPGQRARLKKEVYSGTLDDVMERVGEIAAENADPEERESVRQEVLDGIRGTTVYRFMKLFFEYGRDGTPVGPRPPYVLLDERGREVRRFRSLKALASYADDAAAQPAAASPQA